MGMERRCLLALILLSLILVFASHLGSKGYVVREDENGVPLVDYGWLMWRHVGERRYPVTIAAKADEHYLAYLETGSRRHLQSFLANVDWLVENRVERGGASLFPSDFEYPFYGCRPGWASAMAQGLALKDLVHAYELTGDERYVKVAESVKKAYSMELREGGVLYVDPLDGGWWYAEYACGASPPRVLNGFAYALEGLHVYHRATGDEEAERLYRRGVEELLRHLEDFDAGGWTYYDLEGYPCTQEYHALHLKLLKELYEQTGDESFLLHRYRWGRYTYSALRFQLLLAKHMAGKYIYTPLHRLLKALS